MRAFIALLLVAAVSAKAPLHTNREPIPGKYIVKLKDGYNLDSVAAQVDGQVGAKWRILNGFAASLSDKALSAVLSLPGVEYVEQDGVMHAAYSWGIDRVDSRNLPIDGSYNPNTGNQGAGYTGWVIDTGVHDTHVEFGGRAQQTVNFAGGENADCNGHGTHCSGTVGGVTFGIAPHAQLRGVKVLNCLGSGTNSGVISGVEYVQANADGSSVASMSLGGGVSATLDAAVNNLVNSGVPCAVAAGNDNADACLSSPARADRAVCVGATDNNDDRASYSNWGSCLEIFAPGTDITSAWYTSNTATRVLSGTSMACPHVAGGLILYAKNSNALLNNATPNTVNGPGIGSPNLFLYV